jgi:hypothetical protein
MSIKIKIDKQLSVSEDQSPVYTLKLNVTEAEGITPNIFVVRYTPASKYTGPESYTFWNVAYADELISIPDTPANKRKACELRRPCLVYKCSNTEDLNDFVTTVTSDIQRLIKSLKEQPIESCSTLTITDETAVELPCQPSVEVSADDQPIDNSASTISLSFTGE